MREQSRYVGGVVAELTEVVPSVQEYSHASGPIPRSLPQPVNSLPSIVVVSVRPVFAALDDHANARIYQGSSGGGSQRCPSFKRFTFGAQPDCGLC